MTQDRRHNKLTPLEEELLDLRDTVEELREELRRRDADYAPAQIFPDAWGLSRSEHLALCALVNAKGAGCRRAGLLTICFPRSNSTSEDDLDGFFTRLRRKIEPHGIRIKALPGLGYALEEPVVVLTVTQYEDLLRRDAPPAGPGYAPDSPYAFTPAEDAIVLNGARNTHSIRTVRTELSVRGFRTRSPDAVLRRAAELGQPFPERNPKYKPEEDDIIIACRQERMVITEVKRALLKAGFSRTLNSIKGRILQLELPTLRIAVPEAAKALVLRLAREQAPDMEILAAVKAEGHHMTISQINHMARPHRGLIKKGWTEDRLQILIQGHAAKKTAREIAAELGVTRTHVVGKANELGLYFLRREISPEIVARLRACVGVRGALADLSRDAKIPLSTLSRWGNRLGLSFQEWAPENDDRLREAAAKKIPVQDLAVELRFSVKSLDARALRLGIKLYHPPRIRDARGHFQILRDPPQDLLDKAA